MAVMTLANGAPIFYETSATTTTPADAYAAWAAELGVSSTATLQALDQDDKGFAIDLASSLFAGGSTKALFSSEGAVGFYRATPANTSSTLYSNVSLMYGLGTRPTLLLSFHPEGDLKSFGVKLQRANGVTILFAQHSTYNNESTYRYNVAIRIGEMGSLELVGQAVDQPVNLYLTELAESTTHSVLQQTLALAQTAGSITRLKLDAQLGWQNIVQQAIMAATSPLQLAAGVAYAQLVALGAATTPLGAASAVGIFGNLARGTGWASTPLGQSSAHGQHSTAAWVTVSSPLGAAQAIGQHTTVARAQATTPLGMAQALGRYPIIGFAQATSPLGTAAAVLYHDFSGVPEVANASIFYACQLVDDGVVLATVPMSSWQATLQVDQANYAQAVFPAIGPVADVLAALPASAEFVILRGVKLPDGASVQQEMARAPCQTLQFDRGPYNHTCTVRGYMPAPPIGVFSGECRTMQGIRSISTGPSGIRARCSVDWFLRPGQGAMIDGRETAIGRIGYYISTQDEYMDVSEALNG